MAIVSRRQILWRHFTVYILKQVRRQRAEHTDTPAVIAR